MCSCKNVEIGSHSNEVLINPWWGGNLISVDSCLWKEIHLLWDYRIKTTGCCCGHNKFEPMINVDISHHEKMVKLGYDFYINEFDSICYKPKSI